MSADPATSESSSIRPVFVVGSERSGTTLLAVLLGRHSQLAMTPETHFFRIVPKDWRSMALTREELLKRFRNNPLPAELKLNADQLAARFAIDQPTFAALFRAILQQFAAEQGKPRPGEKTPLHLLNVPTILEWFPEARIVCIVRDGRDVVLSAASMPWAKERRLRRLCWQWIQQQRTAERWLVAYPGHFTRIRYEDLVRNPEGVLRQVDTFVGLPYEAAQLDPRADTMIVNTEMEPWKSDALRDIDPSRIAGWKKKASAEQLRIMNAMMGPELRKLGYDETAVQKSMVDRLVNIWCRTGLYFLWTQGVERHLPSRRAARRALRAGEQHMP